jgi:hypothetical protein
MIKMINKIEFGITSSNFPIKDNPVDQLSLQGIVTNPITRFGLSRTEIEELLQKLQSGEYVCYFEKVEKNENNQS